MVKESGIISSVSVIIPVYEMVLYLEQAIKSVLSQDFPDVRLMLVNDGSGENASRQIAVLAERYGATLLQQTHAGQAAARANGVRHADGDAVLFLDADDLLMPGALAHLAAALTSSGAIAVYGSKHRIDEEGRTISRHPLPKPAQVMSGDILPALLTGMPLLSNGSVMIRRDVAAELDFPVQVRQAEDWITWCRLALKGDIVYAGERSVLAIRKHGENVSNRVTDNPEELFAALDAVYGDPAFILRCGAQKLAGYHKRHIRHIHAYLRWHYSRNGQRLRSWKHGLLAYVGKTG